MTAHRAAAAAAAAAARREQKQKHCHESRNRAAAAAQERAVQSRRACSLSPSLLHSLCVARDNACRRRRCCCCCCCCHGSALLPINTHTHKHGAEPEQERRCSSLAATAAAADRVCGRRETRAAPVVPHSLALLCRHHRRSLCIRLSTLVVAAVSS